MRLQGLIHGHRTKRATLDFASQPAERPKVCHERGERAFAARATEAKRKRDEEQDQGGQNRQRANRQPTIRKRQPLEQQSQRGEENKRTGKGGRFLMEILAYGHTSEHLD